MKQPVQASAEKGVYLFSDSGWRAGTPLICEYLVTETWEDGASRETSTITIKAQDGGALVCLNDRDGSRTLYASADTVSAALKAIERHLKDGSGDWRGWTSSTPRKRK